MFKIKISKKIKYLFIFIFGGLFGVILNNIFINFKKSNNNDSFQLFGKALVEVDGKVLSSTFLPKDSVFEYYNW